MYAFLFWISSHGLFRESPPPKSRKLGTDSDHEITSKSVLLFLTSDKAVCCLDESGDEPKSKLWSQLYLQLKHHELEKLKKISSSPFLSLFHFSPPLLNFRLERIKWASQTYQWRNDQHFLFNFLLWLFGFNQIHNQMFKVKLITMENSRKRNPGILVTPVSTCEFVDQCQLYIGAPL